MAVWTGVVVLEVIGGGINGCGGGGGGGVGGDWRWY